MDGRSVHRHPWAIALLSALLPLRLLAGSLDPPGPPAPTMKTLDQVEPRVPIHAADLPLTISAPGSYYLAEDIGAPAGGITIAASDVTIDLSGHRLAGNVSGDGIGASLPVSNVVIRNGFVEEWLEDGIDLRTAVAVRVIDVHASRNAGYGIVIGDDSRVVDSTARLNSSRGIQVGSGSLVLRCQAASNGGDGFLTGSHSLVADAAAVGNGQDGFDVGLQSRVSNSIAEGNATSGISGSNGVTVTGCSVANNLTGMLLGTQSTVTGCTARLNSADGILVGFESVVRDNLAANNTEGAGIRAANGSGTRIENNSVVGNLVGIQVTTFGNTVFKNSARGNTTDYDIGSGNDVGPIGDAATATSPWANILF